MRRPAGSERGFSLLELLVVVLILVSLVSVAVPIYHRQAYRADDAVLRSNLTNAARFVTTAISSGTAQLVVPATAQPGVYHGTVPTETGELIKTIPGYNRAGGTVWITHLVDRSAFCLAAAGASGTLYYDSTRGGVVSTAGDLCPSAS